jgi:hypothetical protein
MSFFKCQQFFAVTASSVYRVQAKRDEQGNVLVEKVAQAGDSSVAAGQRLSGGPLAVVTRRALHVTGPLKTGPTPYLLHLCDHTSQLVALFTDEQRALACLRAPDRQPWDARWLRHSVKTLRSFGRNHPHFRYYDGPLPGERE